MRKTKKAKTTALTRMRYALAGLAGAGTVATLGLISFNKSAYSAPYNAGLPADSNVVAIVLVAALFCVTAALSWAFMNHLAESASTGSKRPRKR